MALQECRSLAWHRPPGGCTVGSEVFLEGCLVAFELVPGDVPDMCILDQRHPLIASDLNMGLGLQVCGASDPRAPEDERAGIAWVVQYLDDTTVIEFAPEHITFADTAAYASGT